MPQSSLDHWPIDQLLSDWGHHLRQPLPSEMFPCRYPELYVHTEWILTQQPMSCLSWAFSFCGHYWSPEQPCPFPAVHWCGRDHKTLHIYPSPVEEKDFLKKNWWNILNEFQKRGFNLNIHNLHVTSYLLSISCKLGNTLLPSTTSTAFLKSLGSTASINRRFNLIYL